MVDSPEENTEVLVVTKNPGLRLKCRYKDREFHVIGHWAVKKIKVEDVYIWDYVGQYDGFPPA